MQTKRQLQICSMLKKHTSEVLQELGLYIYGGKPLVTVTQVKISPDMALAKIYVSIWNVEDKNEVLLELREAIQPVRQALATRLRHQMRRMPDIVFYEDDTLDEMYRIKDVFNNLHETNQMGDGKTIEDYKLEDYEEEIE